MTAMDDRDHRLRIATEFSTTFFVEAAAGTGKTTALVGRLVAMIVQAQGSLATTVAVTFTEKAAGEMKLRLRLEIEKARLEATGDERQRLDLALEELELARIGTIHSFCGDILRERPVEAGIDPIFQMLQEEDASALIDLAFDRWLQRTLADPPEGVRRVLRRRSGRETAQQQLRSAVHQLCRHRDFAHPWRRDPFNRPAEIDTLMLELADLGELADESTNPESWLTKGLHSIARFVRENTRLERVHSRDYDGLEAALRGFMRAKAWTYKSWKESYGELTDTEVMRRRTSVKAHLDAVVAACDADLAPLLQQELQGAVQEYELLKANQGALDFLDLLIKARDLVKDDDAVRRDLQRRFRRFYVDEFQDTDPLQAEILLLLAADDPKNSDWHTVRPVPGKLFMVGDPKQAIYRFRRADVALYEAIKRRLMEMGAELLHLSRSFRSPPSIQKLVNAAFGPAIGVDPEATGYVALQEARPEIVGQPTIVALPVPEPYGPYGKITNKAIDSSTPPAIAAFIDWLVNESGWTVEEEKRQVAVRPRHIALLFRNLKTFGEDITRPYLRELEARKIAHVLVGGRSFHDREEVIALRTALAAIEWPDDELRVFATLRGPFFAIGDEALLVFRQQAGKDGIFLRRRLDPMRRYDQAAMDPIAAEVADALALLRELHLGRNRRPIGQTITMLLSALRAHAGIALWQNGEQALANCQRLVDQARKFEGRASSFRAFVDQIEADAESAEVDDAPIIEEGTEGVRAMTVHKAKGLDFPVVILVDPTCNAVRDTADRHVDASRSLWLERLCKAAPIELQEANDLELRRDRAEAVRLAYVAATRARDLLVIPTCGDGPIEGWFDVLNPVLYPQGDRRASREAINCPPFGEDSVRVRGKGKVPPGGAVRPGAHTTFTDGPDVVWWDPHLLNLEIEELAALRHQRLLEPSADTDRTDEDGYINWQHDRERLLQAASQPTLTVARTTARARNGAFEDDLALSEVTVDRVDAIDEARPGGRRFGALVHAILAKVPLDAERATIERVAPTEARLIGAPPEEAAAAVEAVLQTLEHPILKDAVRRSDRVYRETPVMLQLDDGTLMEGVVDLAFQDKSSAGWTIVDFKTVREFEAEGVPDEHLRQVAYYCKAIAKAMGTATRGVVLVV